MSLILSLMSLSGTPLHSPFSLMAYEISLLGDIHSVKATDVVRIQVYFIALYALYTIASALYVVSIPTYLAGSFTSAR